MKYYIFYIFLGLFISVISLYFYFNYICQNRVYHAVTTYAPDAITILDLGCGSCCNADKLKKMSKQVTSLDVVDKGICTKPHLFDGKHIPFSDKSFDLGICSFVLHHTHNQIDLLKELKRTCHKVLILENTPRDISEWKYIKKHALSDWGKCVECFHTSEEWENIFISLGYTIEVYSPISKWLCPLSLQPYFYPVSCSLYVIK